MQAMESESPTVFAAIYSAAPMSQADPCGRVAPKISVADGTSAVSVSPLSTAADVGSSRKFVVAETNCAAAVWLKMFPEPRVTPPVSVPLLKRLYCAVVVAPWLEPMVVPAG